MAQGLYKELTLPGGTKESPIVMMSVVMAALDPKSAVMMTHSVNQGPTYTNLCGHKRHQTLETPCRTDGATSTRYC